MERKNRDAKLLADTWSREEERHGEYDRTILETVGSASQDNVGCRMNKESVPLWTSLCEGRTPFDMNGEHEGMWKEVRDWLVKMETNQIIITKNVSLLFCFDVLISESRKS